MKRAILAITAVTTLGAVIGFGFYFSRNSSPAPASEAVESAPEPSTESAPPANPDRPAAPSPARTHAGGTTSTPAPANDAPVSSAAAKDFRPGLSQTIEALSSPQVNFEQKQATWKQLRKAGQLDQVISQLEQRTTSDAQPSADTMAALGQAYFQKCAAVDDLPAQAILIMKADQAFDAALKLDPSNWEARYTKAAAMSHWPLELNKGSDVVEQFRNLIQQQEAQAPQANFARSYVRLGDQYEKMGHADFAQQVWQRGAALFPENDDLQKKLATPAPAK